MSELIEEIHAEFGASESKRPRMDSGGVRRRKINLAIAGCSHGEMDKIYNAIEVEERKKGIKFDVLLCCGDFQVHFWIKTTKDDKN